MRDPRNAERRKIIKQQTSQRRESLADSITIAKSIIDDHAKNKQFEKKASQRRRIIKHCTSTNENKRRMSLAQKLQTGCSVIAPNGIKQESLERPNENCRLTKEQLAGKRKLSLSEEIGVAENVIVDSEKNLEVRSQAIVQQVSSSSLEKSFHLTNFSSIFNTFTFQTFGCCELDNSLAFILFIYLFIYYLFIICHYLIIILFYKLQELNV